MQDNEGSWRGIPGPPADAGFPFFSFRRANLAVDLTTKLRVKGPAVVDLRAKGALGEGEKDAPPAKMAPDKPDPDRPAASRREARPTQPDNPPLPTHADPSPPTPSNAPPIPQP